MCENEVTDIKSSSCLKCKKLKLCKLQVFNLCSYYTVMQVLLYCYSQLLIQAKLKSFQPELLFATQSWGSSFIMTVFLIPGFVPSFTQEEKGKWLTESLKHPQLSLKRYDSTTMSPFRLTSVVLANKGTTWRGQWLLSSSLLRFWKGSEKRSVCFHCDYILNASRLCLFPFKVQFSQL